MTRLTWVTELFGRRQGFPCLFHFITGFYCPGCGGTRAVRLLLQEDIAGSLQYHPFVLYACLVVLLELFFWLYTAAGRIRGNKTLRYLPGMERRYHFWVRAGAAVVIINWVIKNLFLLAGVDLLPPI